MSQNNDALHSFLSHKAQIDSALARLSALSNEHFNTHPHEINWGHVGTLAHYAQLLKHLTDSAFHEGEHSEEGTDDD